MRRPARMAADDGDEVVVEHHQVGGLAGHVRSSSAHRHADVGRAERGRVVHPVAGHRHHLAHRLERLDQPELVEGRHAGEDLRLRERRPERGVVEGLELCSREEPVSVDAGLTERWPRPCSGGRR